MLYKPDHEELINLMLELIPYLPDDQVGNAVRLGQVLRDRSTFRMFALHGETSNVDNEQDGVATPNQILERLADRIHNGQPPLEEVLRSSQDDYERTEILRLLLPRHVVPHDLAVQLIYDFIEEPGMRAGLLELLIPICAEPQRTIIAVNMLQEIRATDEEHRALTLYRAAHAITPQMWPEALEIAHTIPHFDHSHRIHPDILSVLTTLLATAPDDQRFQLEDEVWNELQQRIADDVSFTYDVEDVVHELPERLQKRILETVHSIPEGWEQGGVLRALARSATNDLLSDVVSIAFKKKIV